MVVTNSMIPAAIPRSAEVPRTEIATIMYIKALNRTASKKPNHLGKNKRPISNIHVRKHVIPSNTRITQVK